MKETFLKFIRSFFKKNLYIQKSGLAKGFQREGGLGFLPKTSVSLEEQFLLELNLSGKTVYNIGGWEGIFALFFSRSVGGTGNVYTFEVNPINFTKINRNIDLNKISNVNVYNIGLGSQISKSIFKYSTLDTARGSFDKEIQDTFVGTIASVEIEVNTLDEVQSKMSLKSPHFIKIDTEGFEYDILLGMKNILTTVYPDIFLEIHGNDQTYKAKNLLNIVQYLTVYNYSFYHIETKEYLNTDRLKEYNGGHFYCCVHKK